MSTSKNQQLLCNSKINAITTLSPTPTQKSDRHGGIVPSNPSIGDRDRGFGGQPGVYREFHDRQRYMAKACLIKIHVCMHIDVFMSRVESIYIYTYIYKHTRIINNYLASSNVYVCIFSIIVYMHTYIL
jgi:hypothetical protein